MVTSFIRESTLARSVCDNNNNNNNQNVPNVSTVTAYDSHDLPKFFFFEK